VSFGGLFGCENGATDAFNLDKETLRSLGKNGSQRPPVGGVGMYHQCCSQDEVAFVFHHVGFIPLCKAPNVDQFNKVDLRSLAESD
jgi:hypothetical protein